MTLHENDIGPALDALESGDEAAVAQLMPLVYSELHALAASSLRRERNDHTLQPTALVHEVFIRLRGVDGAQTRVRFLALAATAMRRVLVDHARKRGAQKRGGGLKRVSLDESKFVIEEQAAELLAIDHQLDKLRERDEQLARIVELRFFGGLTHAEIARYLDVSLRTVERGWRLARAWLVAALEA